MGLALAQESQTSGWRAELRLACELATPGLASGEGMKSVIRGRSRCGPLALQRVLYPEGASPCHAIVLHPPGGVAGGDFLAVDVSVAPGAALFSTTPASTKFYKSGGRRATSEQRLRVARGGCLEWFPQETLVFDRADLTLDTEVELEPDSHFAAWEIVCLGRHFMGETFRHGRLVQQWTVWRRGRHRRRVFHERLVLDAADPLRNAPWGLQGRRVLGSLLLSCAQPETEQHLRQRLENAAGAGLVVGLTRLDGLVVLRALADAPQSVRQVFEAAWGQWRRSERRLDAHRPRIWDT